MKRGHTLIAAATIAAATALTLTGCGSSSSDSGTAKAADASAAAAKLDTGTYPTTPQPNFGKAGSASKGTIIEGQRMAEYVTHPWDIDVTLTTKQGNAAKVLKDAGAVSLILSDSLAKSIAGDNYVTGFSSAAQDGDQQLVNHSIVHTVLRFADPASAQKAAQDLQHALLTTDLNAIAGLPPEPGSTPKFRTEDHISALPNTLVSTDDTDGEYTLNALTAHGPYLIYDWLQGKDGSKLADTQSWAATTAAKAVQLQEPRIDQFPATPVDKLADLPVDQDGVLRLTVPLTAADATVNQNAVYGPNGFLHFSGDPLTDKQLIAQTGTDRVAFGGTTLYRAKDAQSAQALLNGFAKENDTTMHPGPAVPGIPGSKCWVKGEDQGGYTDCLITRGRYVADAAGYYLAPSSSDSTSPTTALAPQPGSDITEAHQKAAAQYEILAGQN